MPSDARAILDAEELDTLSLVLPWAAALFLVSALAVLATQAGPPLGAVLLALGGAASFVAWRAIHQHRLPARWSHHVATGIMASGLLATEVAYTSTPRGTAFASFLLLILGSATMLVSPRWTAAFGAVTAATWIANAWTLHDAPLSSTAVLLLVISLSIATGLAVVRSRSAIRHAHARRAVVESEERHRALVEGLPVGVYRTSPDGRVLDANTPAARLMGFRTLRGLLDTPVERLYRDPSLRAAWVARMEREGQVRGEEIEALGPDGRVRWLRDSARTVRGPDGRVLWYEGVVEDITEQKRAQQDLEETRRQVVASEKLSALGALVAGVAHEINNPLTYMRGNGELILESLEQSMRDPALSDATRASLAEAAQLQRAVLRGTDRVAHITRSLKKVARRPSGTRQPESVNSLVESVVTVALARVKDDHEVVTSLRARTPIVANADEISQVLLNVVLNAVDAMEGRPRGCLSIRTSEHGPWVAVDVEDQGRGIPAEEASKIFTPFHTTKPSGTGLGLSVSFGIVESHGGTMSFSSREGRGTTFHILLPKAGAQPPRPEPDRAAPGQPLAPRLAIAPGVQEPGFEPGNP